MTWDTALDSRLNYGPIMTQIVEKYLFCGPSLIELSNSTLLRLASVCSRFLMPGVMFNLWRMRREELRAVDPGGWCVLHLLSPNVTFLSSFISSSPLAEDAAKVTHNLSFLLRLVSRTFFALNKHEMLHFNDLCLGLALNFIALWSGFTILLQWYSLQVIRASMTSARENQRPRVAAIAPIQEISNALNSLIYFSSLQPS